MAWSKTCSGLGVVAIAVGVTVDQNDNTKKTRACQPPHNEYEFCDTTKTIEERVNDLISRLKDEEIPPLLTARAQDGGGGGSPGPSANISRLGIPEYDWGANCIHGVQSSCVRTAEGEVKCPTSFPNPVNFGATFNDSHVRAMGQVIGDELRALWVAGATEFSSWSGRPHVGLDCWSPNINIARDPRWGRNQEVPSEDPLINGRFGYGYTRGVQEPGGASSDDNYVKVISTLKHWDAYSLENSGGYTRHNFDANVSDYTLQDTFWPAWQMSVRDGKALGVMCSYNSLNGVPTCADPFLKHVLRDVWGFDGYVTSDTGALTDIWKEHKYVETKEEAVCAALADGNTDISSDTLYHDALLSAIQGGHCDRSAMENALRNTLGLRFQLGLFDHPLDTPYWDVPLSVVGQNEDLVRLSTLESMVLLSNAQSTLPLAAGLKLAVIGPHAQARTALVGNYLGQLCPDTDSTDCVESPLEAFKRFNVGGRTTYTAGSTLAGDDESGFPDAIAAAQNADAVVLMLGIDGSIEGESKDRKDIDLPAVQHALAAAVLNVGKPVVIVLVNGGMVAVRPERDAQGPVAILEAFYPGVLGAEAIASTIFGENQHLGGKLPITIYDATYINDIAMTEMELDTGVGRTYKYFKGEPVFAFGHGISLTTFSLEVIHPSSLSLDTQGEGQDVSVKVTNTGERVGDEVVQVYYEPKGNGEASSLIRQLIDYQRVHLEPGESVTVTFLIGASRFRQVRRNGNAVAAPGSYDLVLTNGVDQTSRVPATLNGKEVILEEFPSRPTQQTVTVV